MAAEAARRRRPGVENNKAFRGAAESLRERAPGRLRVQTTPGGDPFSSGACRKWIRTPRLDLTNIPDTRRKKGTRFPEFAHNPVGNDAEGE
jgi:hypothetical protein